MRKLYSGFPPALPGVGLVILRVVLALSISQDAWRAFGAFDRSGRGEYLAYSAVLIVLCLPVAAGFLAPIVHAIVAVVESAAMLLRITPEVTFLLLAYTGDPHLLQIAIAIALSLLGPGAYSVDSHLFGRHEIIIRPRTTSTPGPRSRTRK